MNSLSEAQRSVLRTAIAAGRQPNHTAKRSILATGTGPTPNRRAYVVLADHRGLSKYGEAYYEETGHEAPDMAMDLNQTPTRQGDSEFARDRQGKLLMLRTLRPDGAFKYTRAGLHFYSKRQVEYVAHVPVIVEGSRRNGLDYVHKTKLPVSMLGIGRIFAQAGLTQAQRMARVRSFVLQSLDIRSDHGRMILLEISGEVYYYDRNGEWTIDELVTEPTEHGPQVNYRERIVMAGPVANAVFVPFADQVVDEAWEAHPDNLCVVRQLSVLLERSREDLCDEFDRLLDRNWREDGITTDELLYFCKDQALPYYCIVRSRLQKAWTPDEPKGRAIAFCAFGGHCYMYKSARCVSEWTLSEGVRDRVILSGEHRSTLKPMKTWECFEMPPRPGTFMCDDLEFVRKQLLDSGRTARVSLRTLHEIGGLYYKCVEAVDGVKGDCVIRQRPEEADEIEQWLEKLGNPVDWMGERLPAITNRVFLALLAAERRSPTAAEKEEILSRQHNRCALCSGVFDDDVEFDHVAGVKTLVKGQKQTYQALCCSCHAEKTQLERGARSIESRFSKQAWEDFVRSPKPPPLTWQPHPAVDMASIELDVRRCRRNALMYSAHDFSVFCALDSIAPAVEGVLGDFTFVTGVCDDRLSVLSRLPFVGPGWYHRVACEHLLHYGICHWRHFSHSFSATGKLPAACFREPLAKMEAAWDDPDLRKRSINTMVGVWAINRDESFSVVTSASPTDGLHCWMKRPVGDSDLVDYIFRSTLRDNTSMRAIHDQILQTEAVRMAQLLFLVQKCGIAQKSITDVKTDALIVQVAHKKRKLMQTIAETTFADLPQLRGGRKINSYCAVSGVGDKDRVFRYGEETTRLKGLRRTPAIDAAPPTPPSEWTDLDEEEAERRALEGASLLVLGAPGVGKTFWCRQLVKKLRDKGRVDIISKCHASCRNFGDGAVTADHWVRKTVRAGRCAAKTLVVEEISQISCYLWNDIAKAAFMGVQLVLLSDFCQLDPVLDQWCGGIVPDGALERSNLLRELAGGNRMILTTNHRSDEVLFQFYTGLGIGRNPRDLQEALDDARARFPKQRGSPRYTLVLTHAMRMACNRARNLEEKPDCAILYKAARGRIGENQPQHMWVYAGQELVGAGGKVRKGLFVEVMAVTEEQIVLDDGTVLSAADASKCLRLSHALTYAACQGLTLEGRVRLAETTHPAFTLKHLYVGSSRSTAASLLEVC